VSCLKSKRISKEKRWERRNVSFLWTQEQLKVSMRTGGMLGGRKKGDHGMECHEKPVPRKKGMNGKENLLV
jgi:hypothetical protein